MKQIKSSYQDLGVFTSDELFDNYDILEDGSILTNLDNRSIVLFKRYYKSPRFNFSVEKVTITGHEVYYNLCLQPTRKYYESDKERYNKNRCGSGKTVKAGGSILVGGMYGYRNNLRKKPYREASNRKYRRNENNKLKTFKNKFLDLENYLDDEIVDVKDHNCEVKNSLRHRNDNYDWNIW